MGGKEPYFEGSGNPLKKKRKKKLLQKNKNREEVSVCGWGAKRMSHDRPTTGLRPKQNIEPEGNDHKSPGQDFRSSLGGRPSGFR